MKKLSFLLTASVLVFVCAGMDAAVITVNTINNVNPGVGETSLLQALSSLHDGDTIQFNIPGAGPHYIKTPDTGYPFITNSNVIIDGYSQPGASPNSNSILAPNNAKIKIVLDSRDGPEQRTLLGPLNNPGYGDSESAILAVLGAKNFKIRGVSFLSRQTPGAGDDPDIYCIALINDATNAHLNGCWFGLDPDGVTVASGRSAVASFKGVNGASASGLVFGTNGDGQNDEAEFNISMGMGLAIHLETPNVKVSGNFINVFPNGTTFLDLSTIVILDGEGIEAIENGSGDNMVVGTDGNGTGDANERNIFGPVFYNTFAEFWGSATNIVFAGNSVGVGINGQTAITNPSSLINIRNLSSIRIGSNFDGVGDDVEGNLIYNLDSTFIGFNDNNNDNDGADAAQIIARGNSLVNNASAILMQDQNVTIATYYSTVMADSTNNSITTLSTNASGTQLLVSIPPANTNNYPTAIVDFYAVDSVGLTNGPGYVQGKTYLGSVIDGSTQDLDPSPNQIAFFVGNLNLTGTTTLAALVTYSKDNSLVTQAGRAVTAIFSTPVTVAPVAAPPRITSFSASGANVTLSVSGGAPPYQLQVRSDLTTGNWVGVGAPFTASPATFPSAGGNQAFYRVAGQ